MRIKEFVEKYCQDIISYQQLMTVSEGEEGFPYDGLTEDNEGRLVKVIIAGGQEIPVADILTLAPEEFKRFYPFWPAIDAYQNYMDLVDILEGADAAGYIRKNLGNELLDIMEGVKENVDL